MPQAGAMAATCSGASDSTRRSIVLRIGRIVRADAQVEAGVPLSVHS